MLTGGKNYVLTDLKRRFGKPKDKFSLSKNNFSMILGFIWRFFLV